MCIFLWTSRKLPTTTSSCRDWVNAGRVTRVSLRWITSHQIASSKSFFTFILLSAPLDCWQFVWLFVRSRHAANRSVARLSFFVVFSHFSSTANRIRHFAGTMNYSIDDFVEKNSDKIPKHLSSGLYQSKLAIVQNLFPEGNKKIRNDVNCEYRTKPPKPDTHTREIFSRKHFLNSQNTAKKQFLDTQKISTFPLFVFFVFLFFPLHCFAPFDVPTTQHSGNPKRASKKPTNCSSILRTSLQNLLSKIELRKCHYVFCIKSNDKCLPKTFEIPIVQHQVRYMR